MYTINEVDYLIQKAFAAGFNEGKQVYSEKMFGKGIDTLFNRQVDRYIDKRVNGELVNYLPSEVLPYLKDHPKDFESLHQSLRGLKKKKGYKIGQGTGTDNFAFMGVFH